MKQKITTILSILGANLLVLLFFVATLPIQLAIVVFHKLSAYFMPLNGPQNSLEERKGFTIHRESESSSFSWFQKWRQFRPSIPVLHIPRLKTENIPWKTVGFGIGIGLLLTVVSLWWNRPTEETMIADESNPPLYLIQEASEYVPDPETFESKVRWVAWSLEVPPEWLMAVMYSESRFDAGVKNFKGSGATGLIQFMVPAVKDLNRRLGTKFYLSDIENMTAIHQLDLVHEYLQTMRERYRDFHSLTDLYLAILYPKALTGGSGYVLYAKPSKAYRQNSGLDENKDGEVTVSDIDARMQRVFPGAYGATKE